MLNSINSNILSFWQLRYLKFWQFKYLERWWIEWFSVLANGDAFWKLAPGKWTLFGIDDVDNTDDEHDHHQDNDVKNGDDDDDDQDDSDEKCSIPIINIFMTFS